MVRYHRMKGDKTLWVPGTDHAAIATQSKVEEMLYKTQKKTRHDLGREKFLEMVENYAQESHDVIIKQTKKMGSSLDWSREAYTLDEKRTLAVRTAFKKMYDGGLIYQGERIVNWCPRCHSTLADDEVEYKQEKGKLYWLKYGPFVLATARQETKLGDTAVAVHPNDKRYKDMVGKKYKIPGVLGEFEITVVAHRAVDPEFGSGAIKVTPAHDFTDYEIAKENNISMRQIIDEEGKMMANCGKYAGLTTAQAREAIVEDMEKMELIDHIDKNYIHNIALCYRCNNVVEPLPSKQWFINVTKEFAFKQSKQNPIKGLKNGQKVTLKKLMHQVVRTGQVEIIPERFNKTYFHWIDNLRDWCISRQIWYGHQIPVWNRSEVGARKSEVRSQKSEIRNDEIYVGVELPTGEGWAQDEDTLDTWFSSGLWTFSTLDWPKESDDFRTFHPTSVMETGYDILFFWVARMILMSTYLLGEVPFRKVYLHGLVRDEKGQKMSKSLGNVIDPLDVVAKYGTDAVRLSLVIGSTPGNDVRLSEEKIAGYRNFTNKLWNIARYVMQNAEFRMQNELEIKNSELTLAEQWIIGRFDWLKQAVSYDLENFNFSHAGEILRIFTWYDFADWYIEISKFENSKNKDVVLSYILFNLLKLWHLFMPFVTEVIWQEMKHNNLLMVERWPVQEKLKTTSSKLEIPAKKEFDLIVGIIITIRNARAEYSIAPKNKIRAVIYAADLVELIESQKNLIMKMRTGIEELEIKDEINDLEKEMFSSACLHRQVGKVDIYIPLEGVIDVVKEKQRIAKRSQKLKKLTEGIEIKLSNKEFVRRAPKEVVQAEMDKLEEYKIELKKLSAQG